MSNDSVRLLDFLQSRGFVSQSTDYEALRSYLEGGARSAYIGIDPTADSLHAGHLPGLIAGIYFARRGHRLIFVLGCGTAQIGDPSGKSDMRKMLTAADIDRNGEKITRQIETIYKRQGASMEIANNARWLRGLNYIEFLRDIGRHFSVNRMLSFEAYKRRMKTGLSFIEFNYQLLQAYDFLQLYRDYDCRVQFGGDDQWANIIAGVDLIRRLHGYESNSDVSNRHEAWGMTFPLLVDTRGNKMGKTEKGALFLDPDRVSPYQFYQYWRNIDDRDVANIFYRLTLVADEKIAEIVDAKNDINSAKERLAWEVTAFVHGDAAANKCREAARAAFGYGGGNRDAIDRDAIDSATIDREQLKTGVDALSLFAMTPLCATRSEARRLIVQGGASINGKRIEAIDKMITSDWLEDGELLLKAGKKRYYRVVSR